MVGMGTGRRRRRDTMLFMWAMARSAALGDQIGENAWRDHRATDVSQWSEQRWNDEATKIVNELKRQAAEEKGSDA